MSQDFRVRLTPQALADLEEIHAFISRDSPQNAALMIERILDSIDLREVFPHRTVVRLFDTNRIRPADHLDKLWMPYDLLNG